ncbi:AGAP013367-PA [Anopheles gambiae str. PEST]|uniref:AGAP013367-PA n=2 Tax=gambiae species complex TaxID=44542 RepID=F5HM56_ANOGA|nr:AGAP013367-PA [Anopheles gambiae str. PEST]
MILGSTRKSQIILRCFIMIGLNCSTIHAINLSSERKADDLSYGFGYAVNNYETNDIKSHEERRLGDAVVGTYSLLDPDGYNRTVVYKVDGAKGFQAKVFRLPVKGLLNNISENIPNQNRTRDWERRRRRLFRFYNFRKNNGIFKGFFSSKN